MSKTVTSAPRPTAITAAFAPATPPPMTVTRAGRVPGTPGHEQAQPARRAHERRCADGRRETPRHFAHRGEQRQAAARQLHRLVRDRRDAVGHEPFGQRAVGGEVEVGEQDQVLAEVAVLARDRLLDLEQQLSAGPDLRRIVEQRRAGGLVFAIRHRRPVARAALHDDLVPDRDQIVHARRGERDAVLVVLDLVGTEILIDRLLSAPRGSAPGSDRWGGWPRPSVPPPETDSGSFVRCRRPRSPSARPARSSRRSATAVAARPLPSRILRATVVPFGRDHDHDSLGPALGEDAEPLDHDRVGAARGRRSPRGFSRTARTSAPALRCRANGEVAEAVPTRWIALARPVRLTA